MLQNEQEFIRILRGRLDGTLPKEELDDIVSDYAEHFSIGRSNGRTDEELWRALGSPEDLAREIRAMHLVRKAECDRSAKNLTHAVIATIGLGLFNLVFVLVPFIILALLLFVVAFIGFAVAFGGMVGVIYALLQGLGSSAFSVWLSPLAGFFISIGMIATGLLVVIMDFYLAWFCYRGLIRYLKWNISVITGTEGTA